MSWFGRYASDPYLEAVASGDMDAAGRMASAAASAAGYDMEALHGTRGDFSVFESREPNQQPWRFEGREGFFFTEHEGEAEDHAWYARGEGDPRVLRVLLKMDRPYVRKTGKKKAVHFFDNNWEQMQERAKELGADGIVVEDTHPRGHRIFVVYSPGQVKLAEPVTYDDSGAAIPLSERFNPSNPDMRY